jgi:hypothetical protein
LTRGGDGVLVIASDPFVEIGLHGLDRGIELFAKGDA